MSYVETSSAADNFTVRLEWEAPLDDGGAAIASYEVSVGAVPPIVTTATIINLTLDSTQDHRVEITALNTCNEVSDPAMIIINATGTYFMHNALA